jgi:DNA (cytosine-5)-methyltransferase 1
VSDNLPKAKIIDLFAGIGGFHTAFGNLGCETVWASEWNKHARLTYEANYKNTSPELFNGNFAEDITKVNPKDIPYFDILAGGFPCQPFSQAGHKKGFGETRGTLFFDIARILEEKKPRAFFLENVRGLLTHDEGKTLLTIEKVINDLGYSFHYKVIKASDFGLPTHRPRLYMVGFNPDAPFEWPKPIELKKTMSDILGGECPREIGYTLRVGGKGSGIDDRRNWDAYLVDGVPKRITVEQGRELMGFPKNFQFPVSDTQAMKQLGNSVAVDAIQATARQILQTLALQDR